MKFKNIKIEKRKIAVLLTGLLLGSFVGIQSRSFEEIDKLRLRDMQSNIFQEIKILKEKNEDLKKAIIELENTIAQLKDQNLALGAIQDQIDKYKKLSGERAVFGPGINLKINNKISTPWLIDLINELFNSGAQAVSVNGIRLTTFNLGFDTLPQGQIVINGSILSPPFEFKAIGESSVLEANLNVTGGILERLKAAFPDLQAEITKKDVIQIE